LLNLPPPPFFHHLPERNSMVTLTRSLRIIEHGGALVLLQPSMSTRNKEYEEPANDPRQLLLFQVKNVNAHANLLQRHSV